MRIGNWEFSWARALLGTVIGCFAGYQNQVRTGSPLWWLAVPLLAMVFGWRHDSDPGDGPAVD